jgi:hypothetical protein
MKWLKEGMVRGLNLYPYDEVYKVFQALEKAADERDLESLVWCARRLDWFHDRGETAWGDLSDEQVEDLFEQAYRGNVEPPPPLIADLVAADKEGRERATAGKPAGRVREAVAAALRKLDRLDELIDVHASARDGAILAEQVEEIRGGLAALAGEGKA